VIWLCPDDTCLVLADAAAVDFGADDLSAFRGAATSEQRQLFSRGTTPAAFERTWLDKLDGHRRSLSDDP
jgi:hypothetical protein